jgi:hypothetical protein
MHAPRLPCTLYRASKDEDENIPELLRLCNNLADQKNCRAAVDMIAEAKKKSPLKCKSGYTAPPR